MTSRLTLVRATAAAAIVLAPVALTACGSKDDDAAAASSTVATSTTTKTTTATSSAAPTSEAPSEAPSTEAPAEEPKPNEGEVPPPPPAEPAPAPEQVPAAAPIDPANLPPVQPIEGGQPASQADIDAVLGVMRDINSQRSIHGVVRAAFNNTCSQALGPDAEAQLNRELAMTPDVPVATLPGYVPTTVESLNNARVEGDSLSGDLTVNNGGQVQTSTIRMHRENGQWKMCTE